MSILRIKQLSIVFLVFLTTACASKFQLAKDYARQDQWLKSVIEMRKHQRENPDSVEAKSLLRKTEIKAAEYYYQRGMELLLQNEIDAALVQFQQGLIAMPAHEKLKQAMHDTLSRKKAYGLYTEAKRNYDMGRVIQAKGMLNQALELYPTYYEAELFLGKIVEEERKAFDKQFVLVSRDPITLRFKDTKIKTAFEFVVKAYGINVIFDDELKDLPVNIVANNVTFDQAMSLLQRVTKTFYKIVGENTILIASDTADKRAQYEDYIIRVFNLKSIKAKVMTDILKGVLAFNNIIINEDMNSIVIRDTEERLTLAENLVAINDRKPAELILEVEILEVNRTKSELLGIDYGAQIAAEFPTYTGGSLAETLSAGTVTLPKIVLNYFKSEIDAKTLANPKVRVVDNKTAKIHIGDRVPLRSSTIQDATGQTRTTYEYRDIGIRLQVEPDIQVDNSVDVKLGLEVSTLGANLGTDDDPAYSIGTRNAETNMILKDGETAILGGLIRDEERRNRVKVPGLGDIPIAGTLFTQFDDQDVRTDVLLTITPRIVRSWDTATELQRKFYSGREKHYATKPIFGSLDKAFKTGTQSTVGERNLAIPKSPSHFETPSAILGFDEVIYSVLDNSEFTVAVSFSGDENVKYLSMPMLFNPELVEFIDYSVPEGINGEISVQSDSNSGELIVTINDLDSLNENETNNLVNLVLRAKGKGISYLMHKTSGYINESGLHKHVQNSPARIIVK